MLTHRPKKIAIVGLAQSTRDLVQYSDADEFWSLNWWYKGDFLPTVDRMFEMHPIWSVAKSEKEEYRKVREHYEWLQHKHPFPIYTLVKRPEILSSVRYPIEAVADDLYGGRLTVGGKAVNLFGSSLDYMLALAIHLRPKEIELFGVEMGSDTEYRYQRETFAIYEGMALARKIKVTVPGGSILIRNTKLYGYEGGQMIFRQDLERLHTQAVSRSRKELEKLQFMEGRLHNQLQMHLQYPDDDAKAKLEQEVTQQKENAIYAEAFKNTLEYLIREVDGEETELVIENPLKKRQL